MTRSSQKTGGDFLAKKSDVNKLRTDLPSLNDVLVVEDETLDAERLKATLRVMFGYDLEVRCASTAAGAVDCVMERQPDLVFLDDILKPSDNATQTIPFLRRANYTGPIIVISSQVTRNRRKELLDVGANDVIHKDDVDSVELAQSMIRVLKPGKSASKAASGKPKTK